MEHRLGRTLRVFLTILAAAGVYRLTVVPWVEPRSRTGESGVAMTAEQERAIRAAAADALSLPMAQEFFPPGSWELAPDICLKVGRTMRLLCKDPAILPDGRLRLERCTILVLPENRPAAGQTADTAPEGQTDKPPGRTWVLRAPQGAVLEFAAPLDLKRFADLPPLVGGSLRGQVTIRGTPTGPGREDDVEVVTRDIELTELEVRSNAAVQFRHGRSRGEGRGLVAILRPRQAAGPAAPAHGNPGPNIGGIESIRIDRDVRMRLEGLAGGLVPGGGTGTGVSGCGRGRGGAAGRPTGPPRPSRSTCRAPLISPCLSPRQ